MKMTVRKWLVAAAAAAVAIAFVGCGDGAGGRNDDDNGGGGGENGGNGVMGTVFRFSTALAEATGVAAGELAHPAAEALLAQTRMHVAGAGHDHVVLSVGGDATDGWTLEIRTVANWGAGVDLRHAEFAFRAGDVITVSGRDITAGTFEMNTNVGAAQTNTSPMTAGEDFTRSVTLTAAMVTQIAGGDPAGIRLAARPVAEFVIEEILIRGMRDPETPGFAPDQADLTYLTAALDTANNWLDTTEVSVDGGDVLVTAYWVTDAVYQALVAAVAAAQTVFETSTDQDEVDAAVTTLNAAVAVFMAARGPGTLALATDVTITVGGVAQAVIPVAIGGAEIGILADGSGFYYTSTGWQGEAVKFEVDFGAGNTLLDFGSISFTFEGEGTTWKHVGVLAGAIPYSFGTDAPLNGALLVTSTHNWQSGSVELTLPIDSSRAALLDTQTTYVSVYVHSNEGTFTVSDIVFNLGEPGACGYFPCICACEYCGEDPCECELALDSSVDVYAAITDMTGIGTIGSTVFEILQDARPGSVVRLELQNDAGSDRSNWGLGHFGNINITGINPFPDGGTGTFDIALPLVDNNTNIQNGATIIGAELFRLGPPSP